MTTIIVSNGSNWAGEKLDDIERLFEMLKSHPLDRAFEVFGNFYNAAPCYCDQYGNHNHTSEYEGLAAFHGNFYGWSHVFNIKTDDKDLIRRLVLAIDENQKREDYLQQEKPKINEHDYNEDCSCVDCLYISCAKVCAVCNRESA